MLSSHCSTLNVKWLGLTLVINYTIYIKQRGLLHLSFCLVLKRNMSRAIVRKTYLIMLDKGLGRGVESIAKV